MILQSFVAKILYQKRFLVFWWFIALMLMSLITMTFFPSFKQGGLDDVFSNLPDSVQKVVGSIESFKTLTGYIDQQIFALRMPLLSVILAIVVFVGLTAGDEQKKLTETHLSLPISRTKLLLHKLIAGTVITFLASIGMVVGVLVGVALIGESVSIGYVAQSALACWLVSLCFGLVAFCVGGATGKRGLTVGIASGVAFSSYLVTSMAASVAALEQVNKASLFYYYGNSRVSSADVVLLVSVAIVLVVAGVVLFARRDLRT